MMDFIIMELLKNYQNLTRKKCNVLVGIHMKNFVKREKKKNQQILVEIY